MGKLNQIDKAADNKGSGIRTLWQFVKFIVVSLGAFVIQTCLPYLLKIPMSDDFLHKAYKFWFFESEAPDAATGIIAAGLGVFIAANASNIIAQIVSFFINRDKTFNSDANIAVTLPIYIIFTIALICFSAWLSPTLITFFCNHNLEGPALALSGAICGAVQFFLYFPVDKLLFHKKKEEKAEDKTK